MTETRGLLSDRGEQGPDAPVAASAAEPGGRNPVNLSLRGDDDAVRRAAESAGATVVAEADADAVVTAGEAALLSLGTDPADAPVLPVGVDLPHHAVPRDDAEAALESLLAGDYRTAAGPLLSAVVDGETVARAVLDVTLVTSDPAHISEYAVDDGVERVDSFRADGVVAATPVGSGGYVRAVGGPVLAPGTGLVVAPISPYTTRSDVWVLRPPVDLSVIRDEVSVSLVADDRIVRTIDPEEPVRVGRARDLTFLHVSRTTGV